MLTVVHGCGFVFVSFIPWRVSPIPFEGQRLNRGGSRLIWARLSLLVELRGRFTWLTGAVNRPRVKPAVMIVVWGS